MPYVTAILGVLLIASGVHLLVASLTRILP